ncbi:MAG: metallophosphoesterase family protein [Nanoarchaeota archaeon]|nr:metallophosphoesterase family protein [Nanoarchaeota archaeon]
MVATPLYLGKCLHIPLNTKIENLQNYFSGATGTISVGGQALLVPPYQVGLTSPYNLENALLIYMTSNKDKTKKSSKLIFRDKINVKKVEEKNVGFLKLHYLHLKGLNPGHSYEYEITNSPIIGSVNTSTLKDKYFKFLLSSDTQNWDGSQRYDNIKFALVKHMLRERDIKSQLPKLLMNCGDVTQHSRISEWVIHFNKTFHKLLAEMPFYAVKGNHDYKGGAFDKALGYKVNIPGIPIINNQSVNYSFDYGPIHFVVLDSNTGHKITNHYIAKKFLEDDLKKSSGQFNLVFYHHPFEIAMDDLPVDGVFAGHWHTYKRLQHYKTKVPHIILGGFSKLFANELNGWQPSLNGLKIITAQNIHHYISMSFLENKILGEVKDKYGTINDVFTINKR